MPTPLRGFTPGSIAEEVLNAVAPYGVDRYTARAGGQAYLRMPGGHDVRAYSRSHGLTIEFRTDRVVEFILDPMLEPYRRFSLQRNSVGLYTLRATRYNAAEVRRLLSWLATQSAGQTLREARANRNGSRAARRTERRFGVEIELGGPSRAAIIQALEGLGLQVRTGGGHHRTAWTVKGDGSLTISNGTEIVSPPLCGEEGLETLRRVMRALREIGGRVNSSCGLHVHHEVGDLGAVGIARAVRAWHEHQDLIDWMVQPRRRGQNAYCRHWDGYQVEEMEARARNDNEIYTGASGRYMALNVCSYPSYGTIEMRQHGGTLDFRKAEAWIRFGQSLIAAVAAERGSRLTTTGGLRGLLRTIGLDNDSRAFLIGRATEFGAPPEAIGTAQAVAA